MIQETYKQNTSMAGGKTTHFLGDKDPCALPDPPPHTLYWKRRPGNQSHDTDN